MPNFFYSSGAEIDQRLITGDSKFIQSYVTKFSQFFSDHITSPLPTPDGPKPLSFQQRYTAIAAFNQVACGIKNPPKNKPLGFVEWRRKTFLPDSGRSAYNWPKRVREAMARLPIYRQFGQRYEDMMQMPIHEALEIIAEAEKLADLEEKANQQMQESLKSLKPRED